MNLTINGNDEKWISGSLNIAEQMNSRNTANFSVRTENNIAVGQEVLILDGATRIFGGTIDTYSLEWLRGEDTGNRKMYYINCIDFNQLLDKGTKIAVTYKNATINDIVNDTASERTIGTLLASEGIDIGTISSGNTIVKRAVFNYISVSDALSYIKDVVGLNWNVNYNKELRLFFRSDNVGSLDDTKFYNIKKEITRLEYRNSQIVKAGKGRTAIQMLEKPTPKPDGISRTFTLRYPIAEKPDIFIDSVQVSTDNIGINGIDSNKKWYFSYNSNNINQDLSEVVLDDTKNLEITYTGLRDINVQTKNTTGIGSRKEIEDGTTGIYEQVEQKKELDNQLAAVDYANGLLNKFADIPERVYIESSEYLTSGKIITLNEPKVEIDGEYLIESLNIIEDGEIFRYSYNLASGEALGSWVEFFRKLSQDATDFTINDNEVLVVLSKTIEKWKIFEGVKATTVRYKTPQDDLFYLDANKFYSGIGSIEVIK